MAYKVLKLHNGTMIEWKLFPTMNNKPYIQLVVYNALKSHNGTMIEWKQFTTMNNKPYIQLVQEHKSTQ
jgi:hypothetical protein